MKLNHATLQSPPDARLTLVEAGGPRWHFDYDNAQNDPHPDVLVLGTYDNPSTNNELVGGVNLHYLNKDQLDRLRRGLPDILRVHGLKRRYRMGKAMLSDVFNTAYRTYDTQYIRSISPDELAQWEPTEMQPQRPNQPQQTVPAPAAQPQATPVPTATRPPAAIQRQPVAQPQPAAVQPQPEDSDQLQKQRDSEIQALAAAYKGRIAAAQQAKARQAQQQAQQKAIQDLEQERTDNLRDLMTPGDEDPLASGTGMESKIRYWSPAKQRYITESVII